MTFKAKRIDFNRCIDIACEKAGLTLKQAALRAGRDELWLSRDVKRYNPRNSTLRDVCAALDLGLIELLAMGQPEFTCKNPKVSVNLRNCVSIALIERGTNMEQVSKREHCKSWLSPILIRNRPDLNTLHQIADALEMELLDLLTIPERLTKEVARSSCDNELMTMREAKRRLGLPPNVCYSLIDGDFKLIGSRESFEHFNNILKDARAN